MKSLRAHRMDSFGTTIFAVMSALAQESGAVNLGQGFPDYDGPEEVISAAREALAAGHNQYPPGRGVPQLRAAIADHQADRYGLAFDPDNQILVTAGATEALAAAILGLCAPGDEVVFFEPYYDAYPALAALAGARHRVVPLVPPQWTFDPAALEAAVSSRARLVVVNSPHNPTGKVFSALELDQIAQVCVSHDLVAVTDEVYEHLVFDGSHIPLAAMDGMQERTITISSAAKTFSVTGWKIGWACGPGPLIDAVSRVKQFLTYASGTPLQHAVAVGLRLGDERLDALCRELRSKRDLLCSGLAEIGMKVFWPDSGYFTVADIASISGTDAMTFCMEAPRRFGVVAIPAQVFYDSKDRAATHVRWAFCKRRETLEEGLLRLAKLGVERPR
ncbi:MAG: pyridoxal phosphate-dependent aminotransferase [Acidimicrobiales bacterium]